jgi:hypothetical protein
VSRRRTLVFTAVAGILVAALLVAIVSRAGGTGGGSPVKGSTSAAATFDVGSARQRAATVDRSGPVLFPDPQGHSRDIYVQHLGGDDWTAFEARVEGSPRQCVLRWEQDAHRFVDPCDGRNYPSDGAGLVSFPTKVDEKGRVIVDLSRPLRPATTTTGAPIS